MSDGMREERADAVRALFTSRSIALVGATDKSGWSLSTYQNLRNHGFSGNLYLVNPRTEVVHGERTYPTLAAIPERVDLAYVMVPTTAVLSVLREGAALGIRSYVVLTAGFGETGAEGRRAEQEVAEFARAHHLTVLGPNGNGYINAAGDVTPYGLPIPAPLLKGPVGVVLQSGALASAILNFAQARNVGISLLTSMGNETLVSVTDVIDHLIDDPATRVIALFLEQIRHPEEFARVACRASRAGKPIVALKIGSSKIASHTAQAHTGALVGDDAVVGAAFRQLNVIRVRSLEDLVITAGLLAEVGGPLPGRRIGVVTPSGGASEIIADRAEEEGLQFPPYAPETVARLKEIVPDFATVQNPLDVTGYVVVDRTLLGRALEIVAQDPGLDAVLLLNDLPRVPPPDPAAALEIYRANTCRIRSAPLPVVVVSNALVDVTEFGRLIQNESGFPYVAGGIEHGMAALGAVVRWSEALRFGGREVRSPAARDAVVQGERTGAWAEHQAAALLADNKVPVVPSELVADEHAAVAAAERIGFPVVLKAAADGLGHKSDIGGVRLGLTSAEDVRRAHREVCEALRVHRVPASGALVQPQRSGGVELLVGVVRDSAWGLTLAIGLGGVWVEALRDSVLRLLPVDRADVLAALGELRGATLLRGARGAEPADLDAVADAVVRIGQLAQGLGERLESLEVNPLLVQGSRVEALDALVTWRS